MYTCQANTIIVFLYMIHANIDTLKIHYKGTLPSV